MTNNDFATVDNFADTIDPLRSSLLISQVKKWIDEKEKLKDANGKIKNESDIVNDQTQVVAQLNIEYEKIQESLPKLRLEESKVASELQKY